MPTRTANAVWEGDLKEGKGKVALGSGSFEGSYGFASRFEDSKGTNPEELIGAAHASCFSMALANMLAQAGSPAKRIDTKASVKIEKVAEGFRITSIELTTRGEVPGIDEKTFLEHSEKAKTDCPVSQALKGTEIRLQAKLAE